MELGRDRTLNARTFRATVVTAGNATGVEVPVEVVDALGDGKRPKVAITINGHAWRSRIASKSGRYLVGISADHLCTVCEIGLCDRGRGGIDIHRDDLQACDSKC